MTCSGREFRLDDFQRSLPVPALSDFVILLASLPPQSLLGSDVSSLLSHQEFLLFACPKASFIALKLLKALRG